MNNRAKYRFLRQAPPTATPSRTDVRDGVAQPVVDPGALPGWGSVASIPEPRPAGQCHAPLPSYPNVHPAPAPNARINGSDCNLIDAITAANTDTATGSCAAGNPGADTIQLLSDVRLTIVLNPEISGGNGLPGITSPITINGNGHTIARDASASAFRILRVDATGIVTLNATTITGGVVSNDLGGGILNLGTLTLSNSTVSGNTGGAGGGGIHNAGTLTLSNSTVSGNITAISGGGIYNAGTLTLSNSTVSDNSADYGGGIYNNNSSTLSLSNSTVSGNSAGQSGGGLNNTAGRLSLSNSTVSGNTALSSAGGIYNDNSGTLSLSNSTVSGNTALTGGGLYNYNFGNATLVRSLIAGNQGASSGAEIYNDQATIISGNYNLFGHSGENNGQAFVGFTPGGNDILATSGSTRETALTSILNPTLDTNGGGTLTHALVAGSPAVDAAPDGPATDQRGLPRPQGAAFDIGAFEREQAPPPTATPAPPTPTNTPVPPTPTNTPAPPTNTPTPAPRWTRTPRPASYSAVANNDQAMTNEVTPFGSGELTTVADEEQTEQAKALFLPQRRSRKRVRQAMIERSNDALTIAAHFAR